MLRPLASVAVILLSGASCARLPDPVPPPPQRAALTAPPANGPGYFLNMDDPRAALYLVQDFQDKPSGPWRWAYAHPVLRFFVPDAPRLRFVMSFSLPERTFRETGPVTLTLRLNGAIFDRRRFERPGQLEYSHDVPGGLLRPNALNLVAIDPDPVWVSKVDGGKLGFILTRAGFIN